MLYNAHFILKFGWISIKIEIVIHDIRKNLKIFCHTPGKTGSAIELKLFQAFHLLLKVFRFEAFVNRIEGKSFTSKSTSVIFDEKYFYRLLSTINNNIDVKSIDFRYNIAVMQ